MEYICGFVDAPIRNINSPCPIYNAKELWEKKPLKPDTDCRACPYLVIKELLDNGYTCTHTFREKPQRAYRLTLEERKRQELMEHPEFLEID